VLHLRPLRGGLRWGARSVDRSGSHREHLSARRVSAPSDVREAVSSPGPELVELTSARPVCLGNREVSGDGRWSGEPGKRDPVAKWDGVRRGGWLRGGAFASYGRENK
jgi:hypothetical protein